MTSLQTKLESIRSKVGGGLIVSCQAPATSPLGKPAIIAAMAETAALNGAAAVRIDSPANIAAVRDAIDLPIFGIYKIVTAGSDVYITPTLDAAAEVAGAGANVVAVDATMRPRPGGESLACLCRAIREELGLPVMADVATLEEGLHAAEVLGCDFISTTLSGYTEETKHLIANPDFDLIGSLANRIKVPVIAEGRLKSPADVRTAFTQGAFAVVVGNAITGMDTLVQQFAQACK